MSDKNKVLIVGVMFLLLGLFNVVDGFITSYRILKWSHTQGTVLSSYLQECSRGKSGRGLTPKISYSYLVDNATFVGYRIAPEYYATCLATQNAQEVISKYPEQTKVSVYFNHEQATDAFVFGGKIGRWYNLIFVLGGIVGIYLALNLYPRNE